MDAIDRKLRDVKATVHGWMPPAVYRRIYESAAAFPGGTIVEVGTSSGAATIALALGALASGKPFRILSCDLFQPGIRPFGDTPEAKRAALFASFARFGVADHISLVHGDSAALAAQYDPSEVCILLLDADGRIDRDLAVLHPRLAPAATIIVDDIDGWPRLHRGRGAALVDQKHRLTHMLVDRFCEAGLLVHRATEARQTSWFERGRDLASPREFEDLALPAYRQLVYVVLTRRQLGLAGRALRSGARHLPWLARLWRRLRPRRDDPSVPPVTIGSSEHVRLFPIAP